MWQVLACEDVVVSVQRHVHVIMRNHVTTSRRPCSSRLLLLLLPLLRLPGKTDAWQSKSQVLPVRLSEVASAFVGGKVSALQLRSSRFPVRCLRRFATAICGGNHQAYACHPVSMPQVYVMGTGSDNGWEKTWAYDTKSKTWSSNYASRPYPGNHHALTVIGTDVYLVGGLRLPWEQRGWVR